MRPIAESERLERVLERLEWMSAERIWPNGLRYLWTDAFGVVLLVSLWRTLGERRWIDQAEALVAEVERVLGKQRGLRIGEESRRGGQYFHYLALWLFALQRLGTIEPRYHRRALELVHEIHEPFLLRGRGVYWKMREDLSGPYPGFGLGALDAFDGYVSYRLLGERELAPEIEDMDALVESSYRDLWITQDLGLGMMLWMTQFFPREDWARTQRARCLDMLDSMWIEPRGYFCREPGAGQNRFAFTNYGVAIGLQAVDEQPERVERLLDYFATYRSGDEYDRAAITHVMGCCAQLPGDLLVRNWSATSF